MAERARRPEKAANHARFCLFFVYGAERVGPTQLGDFVGQGREVLGVSGAIMYLKYHVGAEENESLHKCANNYFRVPASFLFNLFFSKHSLALFFCVFKSVADRISSENKELLAEKGKMEWLLHELIKKLCIHVQGQHLFSLRLSLLK